MRSSVPAGCLLAGEHRQQAAATPMKTPSSENVNGMHHDLRRSLRSPEVSSPRLGQSKQNSAHYCM